MTVAQVLFLRRELHGSIEGARPRSPVAKILAASVLLGLTPTGSGGSSTARSATPALVGRSAVGSARAGGGTLVYVVDGLSRCASPRPSRSSA